MKRTIIILSIVIPIAGILYICIGLYISSSDCVYQGYSKRNKNDKTLPDAIFQPLYIPLWFPVITGNESEYRKWDKILKVFKPIVTHRLNGHEY